MMRLVVGSVGILAIGWVALYLSGMGVLVAWSGPLRETPSSSESLTCTYFTGVRLVTASYWYSSNGVMGRADCPRFFSIA